MTRQRLQEELTIITASERTTVLFITHSIDEAVFLSDRVIALSGRPGRIVADVRIDLPRPRSLAVRESAAFGQYVTHIRHHFAELGIVKE